MKIHLATYVLGALCGALLLAGCGEKEEAVAPATPGSTSDKPSVASPSRQQMMGSANQTAK